MRPLYTTCQVQASSLCHCKISGCRIILLKIVLHKTNSYFLLSLCMRKTNFIWTSFIKTVPSFDWKLRKRLAGTWQAKGRYFARTVLRKRRKSWILQIFWNVLLFRILAVLLRRNLLVLGIFEFQCDSIINYSMLSMLPEPKYTYLCISCCFRKTKTMSAVKGGQIELIKFFPKQIKRQLVRERCVNMYCTAKYT